MNEFQYLQQMRTLRTDVPPAHDLWTAIAGDLACHRKARQPHPAWAAVAAAVLICIGLAGLQHAYAPLAGAHRSTHHWRPLDPRLSAAAIDLDAAQAQLTQALGQSPGATYLETLLDRTQRQQRRLQRLEHSTI